MAKRAVKACTSALRFDNVVFLEHLPLYSLEDYSRFIIKELEAHVKTSHVLVAQWDGYVLNPKAWKPEWLDYDYIGAPWKDGISGNGGFSLRSRRLLDALQDSRFGPPYYPEDEKICRDWRRELESEFGIRFAPTEIASEFSVEGGRYSGQFGFHSFLTRLPPAVDKPLIFHHAGDHGDMIYSLASVAAKGGGVLYIKPGTWEVRQPATIENAANILPLIRQQSYIQHATFTDRELGHADFDLNDFRKTILGSPNSGSIFTHHLKASGASWPQEKPWLKVDLAVKVAGRPIVVSRSGRYHNPLFPWSKLFKKRGHQMVFIGTEKEHGHFVGRFGHVPYLQTSNLLEAARVIAGAKVFIGNQSCPMAIALGLGVNVIQEAWGPDANCLFERNNFLAVHGNGVKIPPAWLK